MRIFCLLFLIVATSVNIFGNGTWEWKTKEDWERCERIDCDFVKGKIKIINVISDNFDNSYLEKWWEFRFVEDNKGNTYDAKVSLGCVRLISNPEGVGWWCTPSGEEVTAGSIIFQRVNNKYNFEAEISIKNSSLYWHPWGGFTFFITDEDKTNVYRVGWGSRQFGVDKPFSRYCRTICYDQQYQLFYNINYPYYFKIKNEYNSPYNNLTFYYRENTFTAWTEYEKYTNILFNKMYIGVERSDTEPDQWVDIDYFYYYGPVTRRAEINSEIVDLGCEPSGKGTIKWIQNLPDLTTHPVIFYTQTSDDGITWNEEWKGPYTDNNGSEILSVNKRYIRFKGILTTDDERYTPELLKVSIEYPAAAPLSPKITSTVKEDGWTNMNNAMFYFSESESNGVTVNAYYYAIDNEVNTGNSLYTQNAYMNVTDIAEGEHILRVIAQADWRNNSLASSVAEYRFKTDMTPPKKPEVKNASHKQYEESTNNNFEIELKLEDSKINTENVSGIGGISYKLTREEGEQIDDTIDNTTGKIRVNGIDNGTWYFKVKAIDMAGNTGEELTYCIKINYKGVILNKDRAKIYPNPTKGKFKIWYELSGEAERVRIMIKDSSGRTIKEVEGGKEAGVNEKEEEINNLANGVYFVKMRVYRKDGKEDVVVKKLVIYKR